MLKISTIARHGEAPLKSQSWGGWDRQIFNLGASVGYTVSLRIVWVTCCFQRPQRRTGSTVTTNTFSIHRRISSLSACPSPVSSPSETSCLMCVRLSFPRLLITHEFLRYAQLLFAQVHLSWLQGTKETKESSCLLEWGSRETCFLVLPSSWFYPFLAGCQSNCICRFSHFNIL